MEGKNNFFRPESGIPEKKYIYDTMRIFDIVWEDYQKDDNVIKLSDEARNLIAGMAKQRVAEQLLLQKNYSQKDIDDISGINFLKLQDEIRVMSKTKKKNETVRALRIRAKNLVGMVSDPGRIRSKSCREQLLNEGFIIEVEKPKKGLGFKGKIYARPTGIDSISTGTKPDDDLGWSELGKDSDQNKN